jgi:hypothetical protein
VQGNLDPAVLLGPVDRVERAAVGILDAVAGRPATSSTSARRAAGDGPGALARLAELVHARTAAIPAQPEDRAEATAP